MAKLYGAFGMGDPPTPGTSKILAVLGILVGAAVPVIGALAATGLVLLLAGRDRSPPQRRRVP